MKRAMILLVAGAAVSGLAAIAASAREAGSVTLQAMECGRLDQPDLGRFSDTMRFRGERRTLIAGCFLIRHPQGVLLWDTGLLAALSGARAGTAPGMTLDRTLADRLAEIGLRPADVTHVGISHYHADHSGGAAEFAGAELLIGKRDWDALTEMAADNPQVAQLANWLSGGGRSRQVAGDLDLFGDGTVVMLTMPGHTPGHSALLVRLPNSGAVLISGDQYHFRENRTLRGVPTFNTDRADTLASHDRFEQIAEVERARVVIQHEPRDMAALPRFPAALD